MKNEEQRTKRMTPVTKLWIAICILALLSPIGVIVPRLLGAGGAWGEWGLDEVEKIAGFVPEGMRRLAEKWKAPMPDYGLPGQGKGLMGEGLGYVLAGVVGILLVAGAMYALARLLGRKNDKE